MASMRPRRVPRNHRHFQKRLPKNPPRFNEAEARASESRGFYLFSSILLFKRFNEAEARASESLPEDRNKIHKLLGFNEAEARASESPPSRPNNELHEIVASMIPRRVPRNHEPTHGLDFKQSPQGFNEAEARASESRFNFTESLEAESELQ